MTLEPNNIKPGYVLRWSKEAFVLLRDSLVMWLLVLAAPCAATVFLDGSTLSLLCYMVLGIFSVNLSYEMAMTLEHGHIRFRQLPLMAKAAFEGLLSEVIRRRRFLAILLMMFLALDAFQLLGTVGAHVDVAAKPTPPPLSVWGYLTSPRSPLWKLGGLVYFGFLGLRSGEVGSYWRYPLARMFSIEDEDTLAALLEAAKHKNVRTMFNLDIGLGVVCMVCFLLLPGLAPLTLVFLPAFSYVACREVFGPGDPLNVVQEKSVHQANLAGAQG